MKDVRYVVKGDMRLFGSYIHRRKSSNDVMTSAYQPIRLRFLREPVEDARRSVQIQHPTCDAAVFIISMDGGGMRV